LRLKMWRNHGYKFFRTASREYRVMDFLNGIDFTVVFQLSTLALIVIAGPAIVFLLFLKGGDL
jgi:hypothetical protein